ncbi:MAG TPA: hypothetical protein VGF25_06225 [Thermoleophilaceae bacterium]
MGAPTDPERYEPLPGFAELPGWLWRRMGRGGRIAAAIAVLAIVAAGIALAPGIRETKKERAEADRAARSEQLAAKVRRLRREQRPRFGRSESVAPAGAGAAERLRARAAMMDELSGAILADARRRIRAGSLEGPVKRTDCEPFPRTVSGKGAEADLTRRRGNYFCLAVTADFERSEASLGGALGYPYRALVHFETGRYAYCKVAGQPGPTSHQLVVTPKACGG